MSSLIIPRLSKKAAQSKTSSSSSGSLPLQHYTGPTKVNQPAVEDTSGICYEEVCARKVSLATAQEKDMKWLNTLNTQENAMEWGGFNNQEARNDQAQKPASIYMFGPLIDAKAAHPDTVRCGCKAAEKACGTERCSCHHGKISCTVYCACACSDACFNRFKTGDEDQDEVEEEGEADVQDDEETEHLDRAFGSDDEWE